MRLGRVTIYLPFSYVVDLDNENMMKVAKDFLCEDISNRDLVEDFYEIEEEEDETLTVSDISEEILTMLEALYPEVLDEYHDYFKDR